MARCRARRARQEVIVAFVTATIVLVEDESEAAHPGATSLLAGALRASAGPAVDVLAATPEETVNRVAVAGAAADTVVFAQQEGALDSTYRAWAQECLAAGATVVELNVFNLPSAWRPDDPRYAMAVYTEGGALRYRLRTAAAMLKPQASYLALPNVLPFTPEARHQRRHGEPVRLLRMGRPDPIKWSGWEIGFAVRLAEARPDTTITLTLVGAPDELALPDALPVNLSVVRRPYSQDIASVYAEHDVYVHYSRIGETFGNTFAEAQAAGLFVIGAFTPRWDCAPVEYLAPGSSIVGTPRWLDRHPRAVWQVVDAHLASERVIPVHAAGVSAEDYLARLTGLRREGMRPTPGWFSAAAGLARMTRGIHGVAIGWEAPVWEILRGARLRLAQTMKRGG
jgi:hypothetical protein